MKFYVETNELTAHGDSTTSVFHHDQPFDTIDEAKSWAESHPGEGAITIYRCENDILAPVLEKWDDVFAWKPWKP